MHDFFGSFDKIQALFSDYHGYFSANYDLPMFDQKVRYGNALLSRFPLSDTEEFFISGHYHSHQTSSEFAADEGQKEASNLQRVSVKVNDEKSFCLINHHGYWEPSDMGSEISVQKMERVAEIIKTSTRPLIFAGDLNVIPASPAMQPIQALLRDLTQEYNVPTTLSELGKIPNVSCDHICVSDGVEIKSFAVSDALVSDHKALIMEFDVA
jgi:endonuclease/exonuclease/phosphatase family metal-dependent hydrolase